MDIGEKVVWKAETDGEIWAVWPEIPGEKETSDELFEYKRSLGMKNSPRGRMEVTRSSEKAVDAWLRARGIPLTFQSIQSQGQAKS